jgi:hypothetical protein
MKKPEMTSRTRFWAPKPMARPAIARQNSAEGAGAALPLEIVRVAAPGMLLQRVDRGGAETAQHDGRHQNHDDPEAMGEGPLRDDTRIPRQREAVHQRRWIFR